MKKEIRAVTTGRRTSLTQQAYGRIKNDIFSLRLLPKEPLVEAELAQRYSMSKTPVREALLALAREGLVENGPSRGMRVRDFSDEDAVNIMELRELLEPFAVEQAVPLMTQDDIALLHGYLEEATTAIEQGNLPKLSQIGRDFHAALVEPCSNSQIEDVLGRLQDQVHLMTLRLWRLRDAYLKETEQHKAIVKAIEERDATLAAELLRAHIAEFKEDLLAAGVIAKRSRMGRN